MTVVVDVHQELVVDGAILGSDPDHGLLHQNLHLVNLVNLNKLKKILYRGKWVSTSKPNVDAKNPVHRVT